MGFSASLSPAQWCQAFFLISTTFILVVRATLSPQASKPILAYGAHRNTTETTGTNKPDGVLHFVRKVSSIGQVPHKWFTHFYAYSVVSSLFWAQQFICRGQVMQLLARAQVEREPSIPPMELGQVVMLWAMLTLQGSRRLYECLTIMKPGASKMGGVHWLMGIAFYTSMNISIWIEGSASLQDAADGQLAVLFGTPNTFAAVGLYVVGAVQQHRAHKYLASLEKYTLPDKGWFKNIVCAHYTAECLMYAGLAIGGAPRGHLFNKTLLAAMIFVVVNLGVTGASTKKWYTEKFGVDRVGHKWIIIPKVF